MDRQEQQHDQPHLYLHHLPLKVANQFVLHYHRHNKPVVGAKLSLGAFDDDGLLRGVAILGRPVARELDTGRTLEVTRVATDGCPNACSFLYAACRRLSFELGYTRLVTYTLQSEGGISLVAAGWKQVAIITHSPQGWTNRSGRKEDPIYDLTKYRWEALPLKGRKLSPLKALVYPWDILRKVAGEE